jgi:arylsulfatase A-like enzyme
MIPPFVKTNQPLEMYRDKTPIERMGDQSNLTELYTEEAKRFIRDSGDRPFFLYLPYAMPHLPISAGERFRGRSRAGLYGDVIEAIDWSAGEILGELRARGVDGDTMVIFTSDNGPWHDLPERMLAKGNQPWHTGSKSLLRGAKGTTWEGGPRVPGIFRWPGHVAPGRVSAEMASTLDLVPTLAAAAGAELPTDRVYDGFDLMPLLRGANLSPRKEFYYFLGKRLEGLREGSWKLRYAREGAAPLQPRLFDLDVDPAERYDRYPENRETGDRLLGKLRGFALELKAEVAA